MPGSGLPLPARAPKATAGQPVSYTRPRGAGLGRGRGSSTEGSRALPREREGSGGSHREGGQAPSRDTAYLSPASSPPSPGPRSQTEKVKSTNLPIATATGAGGGGGTGGSEDPETGGVRAPDGAGRQVPALARPGLPAQLPPQSRATVRSGPLQPGRQRLSSHPGRHQADTILGSRRLSLEPGLSTPGTARSCGLQVQEHRSVCPPEGQLIRARTSPR